MGLHVDLERIFQDNMKKKVNRFQHFKAKEHEKKK
jgi:hypothetical protein